MIVKWQTSSWGIEINQVSATRETDKCIWTLNSIGAEIRSNKDSEYSKYHDSFYLAKDYLMKRITNRLESLRKETIKKEQELSIVMALEEQAK